MQEVGGLNFYIHKKEIRGGYVFPFSIVVVKRKTDGKFLIIQELDKRWWFPGGGLKSNETFEE